MLKPTCAILKAVEVFTPDRMRGGKRDKSTPSEGLLYAGCYNLIHETQLWLRKKLVRFWNRAKSPQLCLRCDKVELDLLPESSISIAFFECPACERHYAKQRHTSLHDRWLSPLSIAIYPVIFEKKPAQSTARVAKSLKGPFHKKNIQILIDDIEDELTNPKQKVSEILDSHSTEQDLREYLGQLALALRADD